MEVNFLKAFCCYTETHFNQPTDTETIVCFDVVLIACLLFIGMQPVLEYIQMRMQYTDVLTANLLNALLEIYVTRQFSFVRAFGKSESLIFFQSSVDYMHDE